jgi:hypothetical protein
MFALQVQCGPLIRTRVAAISLYGAHRLLRNARQAVQVPKNDHTRSTGSPCAFRACDHGMLRVGNFDTAVAVIATRYCGT